MSQEVPGGERQDAGICFFLEKNGGRDHEALQQSNTVVRMNGISCRDLNAKWIMSSSGMSSKETCSIMVMVQRKCF